MSGESGTALNFMMAMRQARCGGVIESLLHRFASGWNPLSGMDGPLCFVIEACADAGSTISADPHPAERAAP